MIKINNNEIQIIAIKGGVNVGDPSAIDAYLWVDPMANRLWDLREAAIIWMKQNGKKPFVQSGNDKAYCKFMNNGHVNYLQTYPDNTGHDNLLSLPQF